MQAVYLEAQFDSEDNAWAPEIQCPANVCLYKTPNAAATTKRAQKLFQERRAVLKSALEAAGRSAINSLRVCSLFTCQR